MKKTFALTLLLVAPAIASAQVVQPTFQPQVVLPRTSAFAINDLRLADIDGDGIPDLVVATNLGEVAIRYMTPAGTVASVRDVLTSADTGSDAIGIGDVNEDGRLDVIAVNRGDLQGHIGGVYVLLQRADGTFGPPALNGREQAPARIVSLGADASDIAMGDANEDGHLDFIVATDTGSDLLFLGDGTGSFAAPIPITVSTSQYAHVALADINGDGHLDLITNNELALRLGAGDGTFGPPTLLPGSMNNETMAIGDLNGDGRPDIAVAGQSSQFTGNHFLAVLLSQPGGGFAAPIRLGSIGHSNGAAIRLADFNGDGTLDIIASPGDTTSVQMYLNDGTGTFTAGPTFNPSVFDFPRLGAGLLRPGAAADFFVGDLAGNVRYYLNGTAQVVVDTTAPVVTVPSAITAEALSGAGAPVTFAATAQDDEDGALTPSCVPASGSTFNFGATTVTCTARDAAGNLGSASFTVTVLDTTAPSLTLPGALTAEAIGPSGAAVAFAASATDTVDGLVTIACTPPSGATFPLGATTVSCAATDSHGNIARGTFTVTVSDTRAPVLTLPATINVPATMPTGAVVAFVASAVDIVDGAIGVSCAPASGSVFPAGDTTVTCSAADRSGNPVGGSFRVHVRGAGELLDELWALVQGVGPGRSLAEEVTEARDAFRRGEIRCACDELQDFIDEVRAQSGKHVAAATASDFIARATQIRAVLGCSPARRGDDDRRDRRDERDRGRDDRNRDHDRDRDRRRG